jgi:hypothetical protein
MTADERLRAADPLLALRDEIDVDAPPPEAVLEAIVARPRRQRGVLRRAPLLASAALLVVGVVLAIAVPGGGQPDLAARAYAAVSPGDAVLHVVLISRLSVDRGRQRVESWQRGGEMHAIYTGNFGGREARPVEQVLSRDGVLRVRSAGKHARTTRDARVVDVLRRDFIATFRSRYAEDGLKDAGETTFAGKAAQRYIVRGRRGGRDEYYLDRETGLPLGMVNRGPHLVVTTTVDTLERLEPTPANLAKLRFSRP